MSDVICPHGKESRACLICIGNAIGQKPLPRYDVTPPESATPKVDAVEVLCDCGVDYVPSSLARFLETRLRAAEANANTSHLMLGEAIKRWESACTERDTALSDLAEAKRDLQAVALEAYQGADPGSLRSPCRPIIMKAVKGIVIVHNKPAIDAAKSEGEGKS